jgi:uncharacterized protein YbaR (Trm112 family)
MLELLSQMAHEITELHERMDDSEDIIEAIDSDLADIEEYVFEEDDEDLEDDHDHLHEFEIQCPSCDEVVVVDEEDLEDAADEEGELVCPHCHQVIFPDDEELEEEPQE